MLCSLSEDELTRVQQNNSNDSNDEEISTNHYSFKIVSKIKKRANDYNASPGTTGLSQLLLLLLLLQV